MTEPVLGSRRPNHYLGKGGLQPQHLIEAFGLSFNEGCIVKYVVRWRKAGSLRDLRKARQYLDWLIMEAEGHPYIEPNEEDKARAKEAYELPPDPAEDLTLAKARAGHVAISRHYPPPPPRFVPDVWEKALEAPEEGLVPEIVMRNRFQYDWLPYDERTGRPAGWYLQPRFVPDVWEKALKAPEEGLVPEIVMRNRFQYDWLPYDERTGRPAGWYLQREYQKEDHQNERSDKWIPYLDDPTRRSPPRPEDWRRYNVSEPTYFWVGYGRGDGPGGFHLSASAGWARNAGRSSSVDPKGDGSFAGPDGA